VVKKIINSNFDENGIYDILLFSVAVATVAMTGIYSQSPLNVFRKRDCMFLEIQALISFPHTYKHPRMNTRRKKGMPMSYFLRLTTLILLYKATTVARINSTGGRSTATFTLRSSSSEQ
jgi:hypothetical protein